MTNSKSPVKADVAPEELAARSGAVVTFVHEHPYFTLLILLTVCPLLLLAFGWTYLRLTTERQICEELCARGLPTSGLELETWNHPADDGSKDFVEALRMFEGLSSRLGYAEFDRLTTELKPEGFAANQPALNAFFAEILPIQTKIRQAGQHAEITFGVEYRDITRAPFQPLMNYRQYHLALAQQARYEAILRNNPAAGLGTLAEGLRISRKIRTYTLIECLVTIAAQGIDVKTASEILDRAVPDTASLRDLAEAVQNPESQKIAAENIRYAFAGEVISAHETIRAAIRDWRTVARAFPQGRVWGVDLPEGLTSARFLALCDLDYRACMNVQFTIYDLACQPYPRIRQPLNELRQQLSSPGSWDAKRLLLLYNELSGPLLNTIISHVKGQASGLELGIACTLAADRLEGKDWPANLDDARFPRDPFTGLPFKLVVTHEAVLIYSLGPDQKDSGKASVFNKTGDMGGHDVTSGDDDLVFRLPRAPYDNAAAHARPAASVPGR